MGVYKEIAKADGSGVTTFYRLSEENSTVETTSTGTTDTMFDYNDVLNKPSINDVALVGNKTLEDLGIQPAGDYITEIPAEYVTEDELEAKDYATESFVIDQINNAEHFHREIVDALPLTGKDNVLYLVPKVGSDKDIYNEYIWTGVDYEFMGTTAVDLSDYYKKGEVNTLLDNKVTKVNGKQLSTNDYTTAEKTKLASLENYDDSELRSKVDALHNYDDTEVRLDINSLKTKTTNNEIDITSIGNELGYKAEVIRLVKSGDWWLCQDAKGNNLTLEMAMNRLGLPKTILLLENLENDGKYYPVEYKLQEKYIDIIYKDLDGITHHLNYGYNEYFTNTASGDYIHLEDSINYPYKKLEVDGVCEQHSYTGKNKNIRAEEVRAGGADIANSFTNLAEYDGYKNVVKVSSSIGWMTLNTNNMSSDFSKKIASGGINITTMLLIKKTNTNTTIRFYLGSITGGAVYNELKHYKDEANGWAWYYTTHTIPVSPSNTTINNHINSLPTNFETFYIAKIQTLIENAPSDFEPYVGGQPSPSPDYPQSISTIENSLKITSCNKNLINVSKYSDNNYVSQKLFIPVGEYTVKYTGDTSSGIYVRKANGTTPINGTPIIERYNINQLTFTITESGEYYIQFYKSQNGFTLFENAQLEKGTQATPYEQHLETQITANLPDGEFIGKINDTIKDTLKVEYNEEDGQYHLNLYKNIRKVILDGSEGWIKGINAKGLTYFYSSINDRLIGNSNLFVSNFTVENFWILEDYKNLANFSGHNTAFNIMLADTNVTTVNDFKTWLSTHPTEVYYVLETPYVVDLGVVDMPITYNEVTNLFTDSDLMPTMNIEYYTAILENAKDTIIGQDIYLQNEVDNVSSLPADANKGDIRRTKDTKDWYIYDGTEWSAFDKASEVDLSNYLAKDNTVAYKPATDYNPSTKKYVDDSIADIFIPTKVSQLTNDSGFVLKTANDLTNYYNKSNTYNKAEVNALVSSGGGITKDTIISTLGYTPYDSANPNKYISKIPTATSAVLGGVKIGNNLSIDANGVLSASAAGITEEEVNGIIDTYGTKVNLQVGDKLGEKALSYEFPNDIENSINTSTETLCSTTYDSGGIIMISTYSNKLQYRYIDDGGGLSTQELCTISNGAIGDLTNIPKFDIEEVNTNHYLYPYLFFKNQPILDRIENLEENSSKETSRLTIQLDINGPSDWKIGTDNIEINYTNKDGRFVSEKWYPTDITRLGEDKIINIAKGTIFTITSTYNMTNLKKYGECTNVQPLYKNTSSTEITCFIYKDGKVRFWDGEVG